MAPDPDDLLAGLTLEERIQQTRQERLSDILDWSGGDLEGWLARNPVGSLFVGQDVIGQGDGRAARLAELIVRCQRASRIPLSIAGDLENGAGGALDGMTIFPHPMCLGATEDVDLAYRYGRITANEGRSVGFTWNFSPVADLALNWLNPIVGSRALGSEAGRAARLLAPLVRGTQDGGLCATLKHFPGDGVDFRDQHLSLSINHLDQAAWRASHGRMFAAGIAAGAGAVMMGHIALPWFEKAGPDGMPVAASRSAAIIGGLLRGDLGFQGVVVSDALIMAGYTSWGTHEQRIIASLAAGTDVMLWPGQGYPALVSRAIAEGRFDGERLAASVRRILVSKIAQGLWGPPRAVGPVAADPSAAAFARELAARCLTLVRNRRSLLPLDPAQVRSLFLLVATPHRESTLRSIAPLIARLEGRGIRVTVHVNGNCLDLRNMELAGIRFDAFICLFDQGTHAIKNTLRPTGEMAECLWTLQNCEHHHPIVISLGTPFLLQELPGLDTLVNAYSPGAGILEALVPALFGETGFPGRSPVEVGGSWTGPAAAQAASAVG
jgi:beta-N-acetylhexosaminidase